MFSNVHVQIKKEQNGSKENRPASVKKKSLLSFDDIAVLFTIKDEKMQ